MKLTFESERLAFRPVALTDVDLAIEMFTDAEVMRYIAPVMTAEEAAAEMPTSVRRGGGGCIGIWCVSDRLSGEKLGSTLLLPLPVELDDTDWSLVEGDALPDAEIETGYFFKRSAWGKGYATETARRILRFAFEETPLEEVVAVTHVENLKSQQVLKKAGMNHEGMRRAYKSECPAFRLTRAQWLARNASAG